MLRPAFIIQVKTIWRLYFKLPVEEKAYNYKNPMSKTQRSCVLVLIRAVKLASFSSFPLFHRTFIESVLTFCVAVWFGNLNLAYKNRLDGLSEWPVKSLG